MKSLWNDKEAKEYKTDLDLRVYTSRLLGRDSSLVLHGGGNTSVKSTQTNLFCETEDILYVKGSGWDLATIEAEGFAPVKMKMLLRMAELQALNDTDMVKYQRLAMTNPSAPNPSVEAILHAIIPYKFVDHTHTDAVITITNTDGGEEKIKELYGGKVLIIPYIMPGFVLAKLIYDMTRDVKWDELEGMVLMNHGLFTFNETAQKSYEKTIELVDKAEKYLASNGAVLEITQDNPTVDLLELASIRAKVSELKGYATISIFNDSKLASFFSKQNVEQIATQGPLTPDHVIRTKRVPAIIGEDFKADLATYMKEYTKYFEDNKTNEILLNPAPNFAILKNKGTLSFGKNAKEANIIKDINEHTFEAILKAEKLGGYKALSAEKIFEVEYWELEQAKLKKAGNAPEFNGKVALITSDISSKCVDMLKSRGASVVVFDINSDIQNTITSTIKNFGGIDIVVSNEKLIPETIPFLKLGIDSLAIILASTDSQQLIYEDIGIRVNTIIYNKNSENVPELVCAMASKPFAAITGTQVNIG
ncbi:MAG: rhamnose utilization protein RhaD (predicted bifunctional aldolase and dehydrogenase) [Sulfurimonas sp.]|jgi:rhamnose utilization protein RhaD (predicted bifunctional aldolase and dehydrogenase)